MLVVHHSLIVIAVRSWASNRSIAPDYSFPGLEWHLKGTVKCSVLCSTSLDCDVKLWSTPLSLSSSLDPLPPSSYQPALTHSFLLPPFFSSRSLNSLFIPLSFHSLLFTSYIPHLLTLCPPHNNFLLFLCVYPSMSIFSPSAPLIESLETHAYVSRNSSYVVHCKGVCAVWDWDLLGI